MLLLSWNGRRGEEARSRVMMSMLDGPGEDRFRQTWVKEGISRGRAAMRL
jgi:hypothetical protein